MDGFIDKNNFDKPESKYYDIIDYSKNCSSEEFIGQIFCHTNKWYVISDSNVNAEGPYVSLLGSNHNASQTFSQFRTWGASGTNLDGEATVRAVIALEK